MSMSAFHRLAPELARWGVLKNEPWVETAIARMPGYLDNDVRNAATLFTALHPYAVDFLHQAPILPLALRGRALYREKDREWVAKVWHKRLQTHLKLRDVFDYLQLNQALRGLTTKRLQWGSHWPAIHALSHNREFGRTFPALHDVIPKEERAQSQWLYELGELTERCRRRWQDPQFLFAWAATRIAGSSLVFNLTDITDFARARPFNLDWSLQRAIDESERWHMEVAEQGNSNTFRCRYNTGWDNELDFAPFATEATVNGYQVVALNTGRALYEDGRAMHHCVYSYAGDIIRGRARIFSVRDKDGKRVATIEYNKMVTSGLRITGSHTVAWQVVQAKGPCNAPLPPDVKEALKPLWVRIEA